MWRSRFYRMHFQTIRVIRFFISPPQGWGLTQQQISGAPAPLAVSADGQKLAFVASNKEGATLLWIQSLDTLAAQPLAGTEGASSPFWSPDSGFLGFFADGKLKRIAVSGGSPITLCAAPNNRGGIWNRDGIIVFSQNNGQELQKISAAGGTPSAATVLGQGEPFHRRPVFLPDGRHFLYTLTPSSARETLTYLASLDSAKRTLLLSIESTNIAYTQGHILFVRKGALMAQPFDAQRLTGG